MPTFETPQPISAIIELVLGDARITASDRADTIVEVRPSDANCAADVQAAAQTRVECADGRLVVTAPKQWRRFTPFDNGGSIEVTVELPTGSDVEGDSALGNFHTDGELGACRLKTAMGTARVDHARSAHLTSSFGNVTVDRVEGDLDVTAGSGQIRVGEVDGTAAVRSSNGVSVIGQVAGDLRVRSANGDIVVDRAMSSVTAKTACGDIRIGEVVSGVVDLQTSAGEVRVGIHAGTAVWLDVSSKYGRLRNELDVADGPGPSDQTVEVRARTSVGDIVIHRAPAGSTKAAER